MKSLFDSVEMPQNDGLLDEIRRLHRSLPFLVDAAPSPGQVQILPLQGEALKTSFSFETNGWSDEDDCGLPACRLLVHSRSQIHKVSKRQKLCLEPSDSLELLMWRLNV